MYSEIGGGETGAISIQLRMLHHCGYAFIFLQLPDLPSCLVLVGFSLIWILDLIGLWHIVCVLKLPNLI
jgi:hypothetical protein